MAPAFALVEQRSLEQRRRTVVKRFWRSFKLLVSVRKFLEATASARMTVGANFRLSEPPGTTARGPFGEIPPTILSQHGDTATAFIDSINTNPILQCSIEFRIADFHRISSSGILLDGNFPQLYELLPEQPLRLANRICLAGGKPCRILSSNELSVM